MGSDPALAALLLGNESWKVKQAEDRVKAIQQAAKVVKSKSGGTANTALAKAIGVPASQSQGFSQNYDMFEKMMPSNSSFYRKIVGGLTEQLTTPKTKSYTQATPNSVYKTVSGVTSTNYDPGPDTWDVMDIKGFNPTSFTTIPVGKTGKTVTVNSAVADRYQGFLNDLLATGYPINSIGGQVTRNARGSSRPSLHSYGLAIDINPGTNPMTNQLITDMPSNIRDLAAKYGIVWGGDWRGSTKDTMHFSFPYNGGK